MEPDELDIILDMFELDGVLYEVKSNHATLIKFQKGSMR